MGAFFAACLPTLVIEVFLGVVLPAPSSLLAFPLPLGIVLAVKGASSELPESLPTGTSIVGGAFLGEVRDNLEGLL